MDYWFLRQLEELVILEFEIEKYHVGNVPEELILEAKMKGYADRQIAHLLMMKEVHQLRTEMGITRGL